MLVMLLFRVRHCHRLALMGVVFGSSKVKSIGLSLVVPAPLKATAARARYIRMLLYTHRFSGRYHVHTVRVRGAALLSFCESESAHKQEKQSLSHGVAANEERGRSLLCGCAEEGTKPCDPSVCARVPVVCASEQTETVPTAAVHACRL